ncbi:MAG: AtpZ/AtpI family protein [Nitrospiraceae bacterium]|nr:AtpZ/AtpI family protein [Nitrospiraceae bacterium]
MKLYSREFLKAWTVGLNLVISTFVGLAIGYLLDKLFKVTFPWLTIVFLILGIVSGFRDLVRMAKRQNEDGPDKTDL